MTLLRRSLAAALLAIPGLAALPASAAADFRLCNKTPSRVSVAIGYKAETAWRTEGWWNIEPDACATLLAGPLSHRYYYIYAIDNAQNGEWDGPNYMCTQDKEFTIDGVNDCVARGFQRTGFLEIDTGEKQDDWTVQLTDKASRGVGGR